MAPRLKVQAGEVLLHSKHDPCPVHSSPSPPPAATTDLQTALMCEMPTVHYLPAFQRDATYHDSPPHPYRARETDPLQSCRLPQPSPLVSLEPPGAITPRQPGAARGHHPSSLMAVRAALGRTDRRRCSRQTGPRAPHRMDVSSASLPRTSKWSRPVTPLQAEGRCLNPEPSRGKVACDHHLDWTGDA